MLPVVGLPNQPSGANAYLAGIPRDHRSRQKNFRHNLPGESSETGSRGVAREATMRPAVDLSETIGFATDAVEDKCVVTCYVQMLFRVVGLSDGVDESRVDGPFWGVAA